MPASRVSAVDCAERRRNLQLHPARMRLDADGRVVVRHGRGDRAVAEQRVAHVDEALAERRVDQQAVEAWTIDVEVHRRRKSATTWASKCQACGTPEAPSSSFGDLSASITTGSRKHA